MPSSSRRATVGARTLPAALAALALCAASALPAGAIDLVRTGFSGGALSAAGTSYVLQATVAEAGVVGLTAGGSYSLIAGFWGGERGGATGIGDGTGPGLFSNDLLQNAPNPFRIDTGIAFSVSRSAATSLKIYDVRGRHVRTLLDGVSDPGRHRVTWDGRDGSRNPVGNGVYFYRLSIGDWSDTRKMLHIK